MDAPAIGWVRGLDRKSRVEDFVRAAALVHAAEPAARFLVIGGPDAFMPDYAEELWALSAALGFSGALRFLGDRPDVPRLLAAAPAPLAVSGWRTDAVRGVHPIGYRQKTPTEITPSRQAPRLFSAGREVREPGFKKQRS